MQLCHKSNNSNNKQTIDLYPFFQNCNQFFTPLFASLTCVIWKRSLKVELTPSGSFCLGWASGVSQAVLLLVDACWSCERSLHTRGAGGPFVPLASPPAEGRGMTGVAESEREETESWQRGKSESRWWCRIDRWFVKLRGFGRSISPSLPLWRSRTSRAREWNPPRVTMDIICCNPEVMVGSESLRPAPRGFALR